MFGLVPDLSTNIFLIIASITSAVMLSSMKTSFGLSLTLLLLESVLTSPIGSEALASNPSMSTLDVHIVVPKEVSTGQIRNEHYSWIQEVQAQKRHGESQEKGLFPFSLNNHQEDRLGSKLVLQSGSLGYAGNINAEAAEEISKHPHVSW